MQYKDEIEAWLSIAEKAALLAGSYLLNPEQQSKNINSDAGRDIKIAADVESENIILNFLKENSGFSILSEESGMIQRNDRRFTWIIDPLDGSLIICAAFRFVACLLVFGMSKVQYSALLMIFIILNYIRVLPAKEHGLME